MLGRAIGINAFVVATSAALGPTIASAVLAVAQWRWLFGINVPLGLITIAIARYALAGPRAYPPAAEYLGALLYAGMFGLVLSGLQSLAHHSATALALAQIAGGALLGAALVHRELGRDAPLMPFDLLKVRLFRLSLAASIFAFIGQMSALVALPFEIQRLGYSAVETGLYMTPWPVALALTAPFAGRLTDRYPAGTPRRRRTLRHGGGTRAARAFSRHRYGLRVHLAHGGVRLRLRPFPVAQ